MRGDDEQSGHLFSHLSPEQRVPADHPLRTIRVMTDDALRRLSLRFSEERISGSGLRLTDGRMAMRGFVRAAAVPGANDSTCRPRTLAAAAAERLTGGHRLTRRRHVSTTSSYTDVHRSAPADEGVVQGVRGVCDTVLTQSTSDTIPPVAKNSGSPCTAANRRCLRLAA